MQRLIPFVTIVFLLPLCGPKVEKADYVARVNDTYLTADELIKIASYHNISGGISEERLKSVVSNWIEKEIIYQKAKDYHFDQDEVISRKLNNFKKDLINDAYIRYLLQTNVVISEEEIRDYYLANRKSFVRDFDEAKVSHVFVKDFEEANRIKSILRSRNRKEIERLFNTYNFETKTVRRGVSLEEIDKTIFETLPRHILGPIPTDYGYHVIEVISRSKKGTVCPIDDVRDEISQRLTQYKIQANYNAIVDSLIRVANYELKEENLLKIVSQQ